MADPVAAAPAPEASVDDQLLDAFLGAEAQSTETAKAFQRPGEGAQTTDGEEPAEVEASDEETAEAEAETAPEGDEEAEVEAAEPDGDYVEHDGKKIAVGDLLEAYKFKQSTEGQIDQFRQNLVTQANQYVDNQKAELTRRTEALDSAFEMLQALIPKYQRPPPSMLDKNSQDYDPDAFHYLNIQINQMEERVKDARQKVEDARKTRQTDAEQRDMQAVAQSAQYLAKVVPGWSDPKAMHDGVSQLQEALKANYGMTDAMINSVTDARFYLVALDAAAYRASLAKGAPKPKGVVKAAPRLVRSTAKPAATAPMARRQAKAADTLKKTGKVTDLEATYGRFL